MLNDYFFMYRKYNLYLLKNIYNSSLTSIIEKSKEQIKIIDNHNIRINDILQKDVYCQCYEISKFTKDIYNIIK